MNTKAAKNRTGPTAVEASTDDNASSVVDVDTGTTKLQMLIKGCNNIVCGYFACTAGWLR